MSSGDKLPAAVASRYDSGALDSGSLTPGAVESSNSLKPPPHAWVFTICIHLVSRRAEMTISIFAGKGEARQRAHDTKWIFWTPIQSNLIITSILRLVVLVPCTGRDRSSLGPAHQCCSCADLPSLLDARRARISRYDSIGSQNGPIISLSPLDLRVS